MAPPPQVTALLHEWQQGDERALGVLFPLVYDELRRLAHAQRRGPSPLHTLNTTALVHEAYLKLMGAEEVAVNDRAHFLALAARAMRQVLINYARDQRRLKRGGGRRALTLLDEHSAREAPIDLLLAVDGALERLAARNPRLGRVVECRFFGGMSVEETATALDASVRTVERDWARAKLYLAALLDEEGAGGA